MAIQKSSTNDPKKPADIAQVTLLIDSSNSMYPMAGAAQIAIQETIKEFATKQGMVFAIKKFDSHLSTIADFGSDLANTSVFYNPQGAETNLYASIRESIEASMKDADLTPDIKVHHVLVIVTDGEDSRMDPAEIDACKKTIEASDAKTTYIMLDFSGMPAHTNHVGLKGIPFSHGAKEFRAAMAKVLKAIGQVADNVVKQLPPNNGLCLPPAR